MKNASTTKADTAAAQDMVTAPRSPVPSKPFAPLNVSYRQALFHLSGNFKQDTNTNPQLPPVTLLINLLPLDACRS